jgi:hypothetical protein
MRFPGAWDILYPTFKSREMNAIASVDPIRHFDRVMNAMGSV